MVVLRAKVCCFHCHKAVDKSQALIVQNFGKERDYACFKCYQKYRTPSLNTNKEKIKRDLFCEKCRYKFKSKRYICPYCNKSDLVTEANLSVHDLL